MIVQGWNTLPIGAGGLSTGFDIAPDGTAVVRTDVGGAYIFTGKLPADITDPTKKWQQLLTFASLGSGTTMWANIGAYELVIAPSTTTNLYAIFPDTGGSQTTYYLYYSTNSGATWTKTSVSMLNADSNGNQKNAAQKIAVDPNNSNVVYVGMPKDSGNSFSVYRSTNGTTFTGISTATLPETTQDPGVCGIMFDKNSGTVTGVGGLTVTKRIIIPIGGVGIYESNDGGLTFSEVATAAIGTSAISVWQATMDYDGVYYATVINNSSGSVGQLWRYRSGSWARLDNQTNFVNALGSNWYLTNGTVFCDPRPGVGQKGYLTVVGPNGFGVGGTSTNANTATASSITWGGAVGGEVPHNFAASYDVPWLSKGLANNVNAFLGGTYAMIDANGYCWWSGNQGMLWYFTTSDNSTPAIPNYAVSTVTYSTSISRGTECTVAEEVLRPPGATNPIKLCQDVGIQGGSFTDYGADYYFNGDLSATLTGLPRRADAFSASYAPGNPAFVAAKVGCVLLNPTDHKFSGYSTSYGEIGTWTPYANQPEAFYGNSVNVNGGQICVVDEDHHFLCCGAGSSQPIYTANARSGTNSWANCNGLSNINWCRTVYFFGSQPRPRPFAAGQGANIGHAYALDAGLSSAATLYRSTDGGANWSSFGTISPFGVGDGTANGSTFLCPQLSSVPGYPNDLWASAQFVSPTNAGLWHSTDEGATWSAVTLPSSQFMSYFTLGAAISPSTYPTIYVALWDGTAAFPNIKLWYSTDQGVTWNVLGPTGLIEDLPESMQLTGVKSLMGDPATPGLVYASSPGQGFAYYSMFSGNTRRVTVSFGP